MRRRLNLDFAAVLAIVAAGAVSFNALWLQNGRHPAPLFAAPGAPSAGSDQTSTRITHDQATRTRVVQRGLSELGFYDGPIDGLDGPRTRSAVAAYRKAHGLDGSGVADERLLWHVRAASQDVPPVPPVLPPASQVPEADTRIRAVQEVLAQLGYAPGRIDGRLGDQTSAAIARFEQNNGLRVTGRMSATLLGKLSEVSGAALKDSAGL